MVNIWCHIKLTVQLTGAHFSTTNELFDAINIEWNDIETSSCKKIKWFMHI